MSNLHKIYRDVCRGFSTVKWGKHVVCIKHLDHFDQGDIDEYYNLELDKAIKQGVPSKEKKEKWLLDNKLWSREEELTLVSQKDYIEQMEKTKKKMFLKSQIEQHGKILEEETAKYYEMASKKEKLFGLTAEHHAAKKMQFYYIFTSFFEDNELKKRLFKMKDIDNLYEEESYELLELYVECINQFNLTNIKKIAIADFFTSQFYICGEKLFDFFCIPISKLTINQSNLISYGVYYKNLIQNEKIPQGIRDDPDQIEEFVQKSQNFKDMMAKTGGEGGSTGLVGATRGDLKDLGAREESSAMKEAMKKGVTNVNDAMKIGGM